MINFPNVKAMCSDMARDLGGRLVCAKCGAVRLCSERDAAGFLMRGWPMCCGATMSLETGRKS